MQTYKRNLAVSRFFILGGTSFLFCWLQKFLRLWNFIQSLCPVFILVRFFVEAYSKSSETSNMKFFAKTINAFQLLIIFAKSFILDIRQGSDYTCLGHYWIIRCFLRKIIWLSQLLFLISTMQLQKKSPWLFPLRITKSLSFK